MRHLCRITPGTYTHIKLKSKIKNFQMHNGEIIISIPTKKEEEKKKELDLITKEQN